MVAAAIVPQAAKRKKTADMPESPPKRVTRARAKATIDSGTMPKTTKITTASAKASVEKKQAIESARPVKRKTRADDEHDEPIEEAVEEPQPKSKPAKVGGRIKKAVEPTKNALEVVEKAKSATKTKGRPAKAAVAEEPKTEALKPRGRSRNAVVPAVSTSSDTKEPIQKAVPAMRTTRGRAASGAVDTSIIASIPKPTVAKKKVKFQDESDKDKENVPIQVKVPKKTTPATGLKAKPVRKPAVARTTTRVRKAAEQKTQTNDGAHEDGIGPLSPKKVKQIAKSSSISSEDELCGDKSPMRALSISPIKLPTSPNKQIGDRVSKLEILSTVEPASPTKDLLATVLASPARRPPLSPFKDALKGSPRRGDLGDGMVRPTPKSSHSPARILFGESARRGNFGDALGQRHVLSLQSPTKASLLQSPARRPVGSPMKISAPKTPGKLGQSVPIIDAVTASKDVNTFEIPEILSQKSFTSPLRAVRNPESSVKVHKITTIEQETALEQAISTATPTESTQEGMGIRMVALTSLLDKVLETPEEPIFYEPALESLSLSSSRPCKATSEDGGNSNIVDPVEKLADDADYVRSTTPPEPPFLFAAPAFTKVFPTLRHTPEDSDSEDELSSPTKPHAPTPLRNYGVSTKDFSTPGNTKVFAKMATMKSAKDEMIAQGDLQASAKSKDDHNTISVTPLAMQLSSWVASSPEEKTPYNRFSQDHGVFSARSATSLDRPGQVVVESPPKTSFFEDQMAMRDEEGDVTMQEPEIRQEDCIDIQASQDSQASQASEEYGDENALPIDPLLLEAEQKTEDHTLTCTPAKVFSDQPREIHTVSKVPLRPAGDESPRKIPRKRSKSLTGPLAVANNPDRRSADRSSTVISKPQGANAFIYSEEVNMPAINFTTSMEGSIENPQTPKIGSFSIAGSPVGTNTVPDVLKGAVVYVDVHTTEGADASGIFVELLTQMGARCVKQWLWNPRASVSVRPEDETEPSDASTPGGKIGITHVVYKDGGKRTLEKVRESKGVVLCVGVGWVLE